MSYDDRKSYTFAEVAKILESIANELADPTHPDDIRREIEARYVATIEQMRDALRRECSYPGSMAHELSKAKSFEEIAAIALRHGVGPESVAKEYEICAIEMPADEEPDIKKCP